MRRRRRRPRSAAKQTFDPVVGTLAVETDIASLVFSGLTRYDERGGQIPDLAQRIPTRENGDISADSRTITYHLVHNALWHDGVPVTSADVKFTFDALMNPKNNVVQRDPYNQMARQLSYQEFLDFIADKDARYERRRWPRDRDGHAEQRTSGFADPR